MPRISLLILFLIMFGNLLPNTATGQFEKLKFKPGETVEVKFHNQWIEAKVIRLMGNDRMLEASFVNERGDQMTFMFPGRQVRAVDQPAADTGSDSPQPNPLDEASAESRIWNSSDGKFSVEAQYLESDGTTVELQKGNGASISVPLESLSETDVAYVNDQIAAASKPESNPFASVEEPGETPTTKDPTDPFGFDSPSRPNGSPAPEANNPLATDPGNSSPKDVPNPRPNAFPAGRGTTHPFGNSAATPPGTKAPTKSNSNPNRTKKKSSNAATNGHPAPTSPFSAPPAAKPEMAPAGNRGLIRICILLGLFLVGGTSTVWGFLNRRRYV